MSDPAEIENARNALDSVKASEARLSDRIQWPFWRHAATGIAMGVLMVGATLESGLSVIVSFSVVLFAIALRNNDKKNHGMFVSGLRRGKTAWIAFALIAIAVSACLYVKLGIDEPQLARPVFWVLTIGIVCLTTALSYLWQRLYRAELRGQGL